MSREEITPQKLRSQIIVEEFNITDFKALRDSLLEAVKKIQNESLKKTANDFLEARSCLTSFVVQLELLSTACVLEKMGLFENPVELKEGDDKVAHLKKWASAIYLPVEYGLEMAAEPNYVKDASHYAPDLSGLAALATTFVGYLSNMVGSAKPLADSTVHMANSAFNAAQDMKKACEAEVHARIVHYFFPMKAIRAAESAVESQARLEN